MTTSPQLSEAFTSNTQSNFLFGSNLIPNWGIKIIKSRQFAKRIVKLYQFLKGKEIDEIRKQVLRSGTSIGANIAESVFSESKIDFKHKLSIALKEANETQYWLEVLFFGDYLSKNLYESLRKDCAELILILSSITKTIKDAGS